MSAPKWDGKLYRPTKFGEGMQPGTVEWERQKRHRRAQVEHWRAVKSQIEPPPVRDGFIARLFKGLFGFSRRAKEHARGRW